MCVTLSLGYVCVSMSIAVSETLPLLQGAHTHVQTHTRTGVEIHAVVKITLEWECSTLHEPLAAVSK